MWKAAEEVRKINDSSKERVLRKLKKYAKEDGFSFDTSNENQLIIEANHSFWGNLKNKIYLEEKGNSVLLREEKYTSQKLKYFLLLGILFLFIPSSLLFFLQFTAVNYLIFFSTILWLIYYNLLSDTDPYEKDLGELFENAKVVETENSFFRIVMAELLFGLSPIILFLLTSFRSIGLVGSLIFVLGILFLFIVYIAWRSMEENEWFSHHFGIILMGVSLQIVSLFFPSIVLALGATGIPSFSSLFQVSNLAIISLAAEWVLFSWALISLSRLDEDYLRKNRSQISLDMLEDDQSLIDKKLALLTFLAQIFLYLTPIALIIFSYGKIKSTSILLFKVGVPALLLALYLFFLLLPFLLMFVGMLVNFFRRRKASTELRKQASNTSYSEKEQFVRNFLKEKIGTISSFEEYGIIISDSREIQCNTITSGLLRREAYVVISKGMLTQFSRDEIKSFLYHEIYHLRNDSLLLAFLGIFSQFLFLGNGVLTAITDFSSREYLADKHASKQVGSERFIETLEKLRQEKVKREFASYFPSLNFFGEEGRNDSDSWIGNIYWKVYGNYIPLYSHPTINERIEYLRNTFS